MHPHEVALHADGVLVGPHQVDLGELRTQGALTRGVAGRRRRRKEREGVHVHGKLVCTLCGHGVGHSSWIGKKEKAETNG